MNDAVQHNLNTLKNRGYQIVEPGSGLMACGTTGPGRLPEPVEILDALITSLTEKDLLRQTHPDHRRPDKRAC